VKEHGISFARARSVVRLSRTAWYRRPRSRMERDPDVIEVLNEIVGRKLSWGFWKRHDRLRLEGCEINHKRLPRVYCAMGLNLARRTRRRLPVRPRRRLTAPSGLNVVWAADFMADALYGGRWFRTLNVIDEGNRQSDPGAGAGDRDAR
jgi:putative transposase